MIKKNLTGHIIFSSMKPSAVLSNGGGNKCKGSIVATGKNFINDLKIRPGFKDASA